MFGVKLMFRSLALRQSRLFSDMVCFSPKVWCEVDVSGVSPSSEQTLDQQGLIWFVSRLMFGVKLTFRSLALRQSRLFSDMICFSPKL